MSCRKRSIERAGMAVARTREYRQDRQNRRLGRLPLVTAAQVELYLRGYEFRRSNSRSCTFEDAANAQGALFVGDGGGHPPGRPVSVRPAGPDVARAVPQVQLPDGHLFPGQRDPAGDHELADVPGAGVSRGMTNDQAPMNNAKSALVIGIWSLVIFSTPPAYTCSRNVSQLMIPSRIALTRKEMSIR